VTVIHPTKELEDKQAKRFDILSGFFVCVFFASRIITNSGSMKLAHLIPPGDDISIAFL
jgi:hypothetical protein